MIHFIVAVAFVAAPSPSHAASIEASASEGAPIGGAAVAGSKTARTVPGAGEQARSLGLGDGAQTVGEGSPREAASTRESASAKRQPGQATQNFGMIGAGVMGKGVVLRAAEAGFSVAVYDLSVEASKKIEQEAGALDVMATKDMAEFVASLGHPRRIMMLVPDGKPVDSVLAQLTPLLEPGDVVIESANSYFEDSQRREGELKRRGILYVPMGISGGERGARNGASLMPGGDPEAYEKVRDVLEAVAGRDAEGRPVVAWMGRGGAGHFVKMVHNGIEYAELQALAESYDMFKRSGMSAGQIADVFDQWDETDASSFLVQTAAKVLRRTDPQTGRPLVDLIRDQAAQKGTGRNTQIESLKHGAVTPTIDAAIEARSLSSFKELRAKLSKLLAGPGTAGPWSRIVAWFKARRVRADRGGMVADARDAFSMTKLLAFAQGFSLLKSASDAYGFGIDLQRVVAVWRAGCILQSRMVDALEGYLASAGRWQNLLEIGQVQNDLNARQDALRRIVIRAVVNGLPVPGFYSSLAYYDGLRAETSPANLIQALRDYFGAHRYSRVDAPPGQTFHDPTWENEAPK